MISLQQVERALDVVGSYDEKWKAARWEMGDHYLDMLTNMHKQRYLIDDYSQARALIRRAQMERAWPMLAHLDIYRWPA